MNTLNLKIDSDLFSLETEFETEVDKDIYEKFMKDFWYWFMLAASHPDKNKRMETTFRMIQALMNWESVLTDKSKDDVTITQINS